MHAVSMYFPTGLTPKEAVSVFESTKSHHVTYYNNSQIANIVNADKTSKILFTSSMPFANVNFFVDNYFDRAIYFDHYSQTFSNEDLDRIISRFEIDYIVINNISVDSDMECLSESQKIAKETVLKHGEIILETSAFTVLKVK